MAWTSLLLFLIILAVAPLQESVNDIQVRPHVADDPTGSKWKNRARHIFVWATNGKPVYTRYGDEDNLSELFAAMTTMVAFVVDRGDELKSIQAGDRLFVFLNRPPLQMAAIGGAGTTVTGLMATLTLIHQQVFALLTGSISKIFEKQGNFDLRSLLGGTSRVFDSLISHSGVEPALPLNAIRVMHLPGQNRVTATRILSQFAPKGLVCGILAAKGMVVSAVRSKKSPLNASDVAVVLNLVASAASLRSHESWTPLCLPAFNDKGFLYAYVCFVAPEVVLLLITPKADMFYAASESRGKIASELEKTGILDAVTLELTRGGYAANVAGVPLLRHFVYMSLSSTPMQLTAPRFDAPYSSRKEQKRLTKLYVATAATLHSRKARVLYTVGAREAILAWAGGGFLIMAMLPPLAGRAAAVTAANTLVRWVRSSEEALLLGELPICE